MSYHGDANAVDVMNQLRQNELRLESKWVTQDGNFRIATGILGMTVVDVYRLSQHHALMLSGKIKTYKYKVLIHVFCYLIYVSICFYFIITRYADYYI